jgi:hypothetical protein
VTALRLYLDEDSMDDDLVAALRQRSIDVETASNQGMLRRGATAMEQRTVAHSVQLQRW